MINVGAVTHLAAYLTHCRVGAATTARAQLLVPCVHNWQGQVMASLGAESVATIVATVAKFPNVHNVRKTRAVVASDEEMLALLTWLVQDAFAAMRGSPVHIAAPPWRRSAARLVAAIALLCGARVTAHPAHPEKWCVHARGKPHTVKDIGL